MKLSTLEERRESWDLIIMYKLMNNPEETDRKDLILGRKKEKLDIWRDKKKLQKGICLNTKKYSFPQRSIYTWNGLKKEVIIERKNGQI